MAHGEPRCNLLYKCKLLVRIRQNYLILSNYLDENLSQLTFWSSGSWDLHYINTVIGVFLGCSLQILASN